MDPEMLKYRTCSSCPYKEIRGSRQGAFIAGQFLCDDCYARISRRSEDIIREMRSEWPERS